MFPLPDDGSVFRGTDRALESDQLSPTFFFSRLSWSQDFLSDEATAWVDACPYEAVRSDGGSLGSN